MSTNPTPSPEQKELPTKEQLEASKKWYSNKHRNSVVLPNLIECCIEATQDVVAGYSFGCEFHAEKIVNYIESEIEKARLSGIREEREKMINLSDSIELEGNTTLEEWKAFKRFRNTLRDFLSDQKES